MVQSTANAPTNNIVDTMVIAARVVLVVVLVDDNNDVLFTI